MLSFVLRRTALAVLVALTVLTFAFVLTRLAGDLAIVIAGPEARAEDVEAIRRAYGLDRPVVIQFFDWAWRAATGDFGESFFFRERVSTLIWQRLPVTLTLGMVGIGIALAVAIPLGILAALRENTWIDRAVGLVAMVGQALPSFWLALLLMLFFGLQLGWLPISGTGSWEHYVMPGIVLSFSAIPALMRLTRAGMIDAMSSDYIRTARAKGLREFGVVMRHAAKNALIPVLTVLGPIFAGLITGSLVIERMFAIPGLGGEFVRSVIIRDYGLIMGVTVFFAVVIAVMNLIVDLLYGIADPRIRY